jgi:predicted AlkP superfamily phosphohydrolase/phosphomutase
VDLRFRFRLNELSEDHLEIYATPLNQSVSSPVIPFYYPEEVGKLLSASLDPYVVEGAGWRMSEDEPLLDALYEQIDEVGRRHFEASMLLLSSKPEWSFFAHVFTESDRIQHPFWRFHEPDAFEGVDPALADRHGGKVSSIMETIDRRIGKLVDRADENTLIAVISDHGFEAGSETGQGTHSIDGIFILAGKGVPETGPSLDFDIEKFQRASVLDITPTLLCLMGYPQAKDFDGKPLALAETNPCAMDPIDSYETSSHGGGGETLDPTTFDQLRSLGYVR